MTSQEPRTKKPKANDATPQVNEHQTPAIIPSAHAPDMNESKRTVTTHWNMEENAKLLAEKDKLLAEQAEKLAEKDMQLVEQAEKLAENNMQLAEQAEKLYKNSIASMFYDKNSTSSIIESELIGTNYSHSYPNHLEATADTKVFKVHFMKQVLTKELKGFDFKFEEVQSAYKIRCREKQPSFENESDVQNCLDSILNDVTEVWNCIISKVVGPSEKKVLLATRTESSLFSNVIDHVVVYDKLSSTPIFAVETKKILDDTVVDKTKVLGQALDQLRAMKLMGHPCPFGALSCHNATFITWLDSNPHNKIVVDHNLRGFDLTRLRKIIDPLPTRDAIDVGFSQSPIKMSPNAGDVRTISPETEDSTSSTAKETVRTLCISQQFDQKKILDVFANAIFCSLHDCSRPRTVIDFKLNDTVEIKEAIGLTEKSYKWHNFTTTNRGPMTPAMRVESSCDSATTNSRGPKTRAQSSHGSATTGKQNMLYLVSFVGRGKTSKVYRAISESGYDCVVKMFVQRRDSNNSIMPEKEFLKATKELADKEFANYKAIYGTGALMEYVWRETLNNLHCIIMPFFQPIKKVKRDSEGVTAAIRKRLQQFGKAKKVFKPDDQSWRHIGYFRSELYLFDLGHLVHLEEPVETYITSHLQCLKYRAGLPTDP